MKQKNLVLMVVAVGCGLAAAFLTSTMTGRSRQEVQLVEILVASKQLNPGTRFTKDSIKDLVKTKKLPPSEVPQNAADKIEDLIDKQLIKTLRADDHISVADLGVWNAIEPPPGYDLVTLRMPIEHSTPFVKPTSRVDVWGTLTTRRGVVKGKVLIPSMLVMAVDIQTTPGDGSGGKLNIQVLTLAAKPDESLLIRLAEKANVQLSLTLLNPKDPPPASKKEWSYQAEEKWLNDQTTEAQQAAPAADPAPMTDTAPSEPQKAQVRYLVPKENLAPGTSLTADVITDKFEDKLADALPEGAVTDLEAYLGKYVTKQLFKGKPFKADAFGANPNGKPVETAEAPKVEPKPKPVPEKKYIEKFTWIHNGKESKQYLIRIYEDGSSKVIREVTAEETEKKDAAPKKDEPKKDEPAAGSKLS